jgi:hypothetical protein
LSRDGLAMVDISEVPEVLWGLAANPLLLGYKFLEPAYHLELKVKKHADVGVLIAACDEAHFITTVSGEGKVLHKLVLRIRNTQKQYVRIKIPGRYEIWSTTVAGSPVKPAMDEEGQVMVPLQKSKVNKSDEAGSINGTKQKPFMVELVYIEDEDREMDDYGRLEIEFAQLDIPINYLFVSLWLPQEFKYGEFEGDLNEVQHFSRTPPHASSFRESPAPHMYRTQSISNIDTLLEKSVQLQAASFAYKSKGRSTQSKGVGVLPVQVEMPTSGQQFMFEQLIVMGGKLSVQVEYRSMKDASYGRRRTRRWWNCCC